MCADTSGDAISQSQASPADIWPIVADWDCCAQCNQYGPEQLGEDTPEASQPPDSAPQMSEASLVVSLQRLTPAGLKRKYELWQLFNNLNSSMFLRSSYGCKQGQRRVPWIPENYLRLEKQATRVLDNKTQMLEILCQCIISMVIKICTAIFNVR